MRLILLICSIFFALGLFSILSAADEMVTPYGDYCRDYTTYGTCRDMLPLRESMIALDRYYRERGYKVGVVNHKGRFIEAEIYKYDRKVDKVLFDRKSGRVRSIY